MRDRFTFLMYDEGGTFVRLKLLSKKFIRIFCAAGIFFLVLLGFVFVDYAFLKYSSYQSRDLRDEVRSLKADLKDRNQQIEAFYTKIDALQLKLIKLNQLEQEIRSYTGLNNSSHETGDYGVGGIFSEESGEKLCTREFYSKFLENMEADVNMLDRRIGDQSEEFHMLWETLKEIKAIQQVTPSMRPVAGGWVSSKFGFRKSPFSDNHEFHAGVDIATHKGSPVMATAAGKVTFAGYKGTYGKVVYIDHGFGIMTRYAHLNRCHVKEGQRVSRGEVIGEVGSTGKSTGPHLHYEVRLNDIPVNAEKYMSEYLAKSDPS
jgi:murein DD-endopeptidase MepM/ murein hydrolase activator NlpD